MTGFIDFKGVMIMAIVNKVIIVEGKSDKKEFNKSLQNQSILFVLMEQ